QIESAHSLRSQAEEKEHAGQRSLTYGLGLTAAGVVLSVVGVFTAWWLIVAGLAGGVAGAVIAARGKRKVNRASSERRVAEEAAARVEREAHGEEVRRETL